MTMREIITELRQQEGYSIQIFADMLEIHPNSIRDWESGRSSPTMRNAKRIKRYVKSLTQDETTKRLLANIDALYPDPSKGTTGWRLRELRETHDYTQYEFGKLLNASPSTISLLETNTREMSGDTIKLIAKTFQVPADWLLGCLFEDLTVQEAKRLHLITEKASKQLGKRCDGNERGV